MKKLIIKIINGIKFLYSQRKSFDGFDWLALIFATLTVLMVISTVIWIIIYNYYK